MLRDALTRLFPDLQRLPAGAYVVGGAVRDLLLGIDPADVDLACDDPRACAEAIGGRLVHLGRGEVATWRVVTARHEFDCTALTGGSIEVDLARRDFTVNAMAVELSTGRVIDPFGGERDLEARVMRLVRVENFDDDPLRMLKGVRQAVCLRFSINEMTLEAMRVRAAAIVRVAPERVTYELSLLFSCGAFRRAVTLLHDCGLDVPLFGRALDSSQWHADDVPLAAAMALVVGDPRAYSERWRWSESLRRDVASLQRIESTDRLAMFNAGESAARQYPALLRALGRNKDAALAEDAMSDALFEMRALLTGEEIAEITGIEPGRALGAIKRELLEAQVRGDVTTREQALAFVSSSDGRATRRP